MDDFDLKHIIIGISIVLLAVAISGCSSDSSNYNGPTKTYTWQGTTFNIPSSWEVNESSSQVFLYDPQKSKTKGVIVMKIQLSNESSIMGKESFQDYVNNQIEGAKRLEWYVSHRNFTVNGMTAWEVITKPGGENTRLINVYIEPKSGQVYSISILDTPQDVEQWRQYLNLVLNSFKVQ